MRAVYSSCLKLKICPGGAELQSHRQRRIRFNPGRADTLFACKRVIFQLLVSDATDVKL